MKKTLMILLLVIFCSKTFSQDSKISIGLISSPTITWLSGNQMLGTVDMRFSYSFGFISEYMIGSQMSLKSGLAYERKGIRTDIVITDINGMFTGTMDIYSNFDYLILPILSSFSTKGKVKAHFDTGPFLGYLLSQKTISDPYNVTLGESNDGMDITKKFDFGISVGTGMNFLVTDRLLFDLGLQANFGLINISKAQVIDNGSVRTNSLGLLFSVKYMLYYM